MQYLDRWYLKRKMNINSCLLQWSALTTKLLLGLCLELLDFTNYTRQATVIVYAITGSQTWVVAIKSYFAYLFSCVKK